jgi:hypothetical protein
VTDVTDIICTRKVGAVTTQADTRFVSLTTILRSRDFRAGVADARSGKPARFDEFADNWFYEWGRQWAFIAPMSLAPTDRRAVRYLINAFDRGDLVEGECSHG